MAPPAPSLWEKASEAISDFLSDCKLDDAAAAVRAACLLGAAEDGMPLATKLSVLATTLTTLAMEGSGAHRGDGDLKDSNVYPFEGCDEEWVDGMLQRIASSDAVKHGCLDAELVLRLDKALASLPAPPSWLDPPAGGDAGVVPATEPAPAPPAPPPEPAPPSAHYVRHVDRNFDESIPDEYRDDNDHGYRIREVTESELLQDIQEQYAEAMAAHTAAAAAAAAKEAHAVAAGRASGRRGVDDDELLHAGGETSPSMALADVATPRSTSSGGGGLKGFVKTAGSAMLAALGMGAADRDGAIASGGDEERAEPTNDVVANTHSEASPEFGGHGEAVPSFGATSGGFQEGTLSSRAQQAMAQAQASGGNEQAEAASPEPLLAASAPAPAPTQLASAASEASLSAQAIQAFSGEHAAADQATLAAQAARVLQAAAPAPEPGPAAAAAASAAAAAAAAAGANAYQPQAMAMPHALACKQKDRRRRPPVRYAESGDPFYPAELDGVVYDSFGLRVIFERDRTGFEESKEFPIRTNSIVAARYLVIEYLGSAAFSRAVQCLDLQTNVMVCMKIIKNDKDFLDQSLDEIKLLKLINVNIDNVDDKHCLRLIDYFYHKEHLIIVTELLRDNLYEFSKFNREHCDEPYFTLGRLQRITKQVLVALEYIHSLWLIHADLKPENILVKSYSRCEVKVIDFGSSCFVDDHLSNYVQSRSYRAPEVILGLPYGQGIDIWSLGCIVAELWTGYVLFQNDSIQSLLARIIGIIGPFPQKMLVAGRFVPQYFSQDGRLFREVSEATQGPAGSPGSDRRMHLYMSKRSSLKQRMRTDDKEFVDFLSCLLRLDTSERPSASEALQHPWLSPGRYTDGL